jgi:putative ABC transport system substrate-binding protein
MNRRGLLSLIGGASLLSVTGYPQQKPMPVIGFLGAFAPSASAIIKLEQVAFHQGLGEIGYVEGENVAIEYWRGEGDLTRLPALAADAVARKVDVIVTQGADASSIAAKNATSTIPVLFHSARDPVALGLVSSLARPGGNVTGVAMLSVDLAPKLLEMLLELLPHGRAIAVLVNPDTPETHRVVDDLQSAARARRVDLHVLNVSSESEAARAFATLVGLRAEGIMFSPVLAFRPQIAALALQHGIPAIAVQRDFANAGGLLSYGPSNTEIYRLIGIYAGKILKGAKPADLPVQQPTRFELVINLKTAEALGLSVPQSLLARADKVIE